MQELEPDMADTTAIKLSALILQEVRVYLRLLPPTVNEFLAQPFQTHQDWDN